MLRHATYWLLRLANPPLFTIRIRSGIAHLTKGRAPAGLVADCTAVARDFGIRSGHVDCVAGPRGVVLRFSPGVCAESHQRFRNILGAHRSKV